MTEKKRIQPGERIRKTFKASDTWNCSQCDQEQAFGVWVAAHWDELLIHECECGAKHHILGGAIEFEGMAKGRAKPEPVPHSPRIFDKYKRNKDGLMLTVELVSAAGWVFFKRDRNGTRFWASPNSLREKYTFLVAASLPEVKDANARKPHAKKRG